MVHVFLAVFCGTILWKQALSVQEGEPGNDFPTKRKASLFLVNNNIPGLDGVVSPEDTLPSANDYLIHQGTVVDPELKSSVLKGNYPESELKIERVTMPPIKQKDEDDDSGNGIINKKLLNKLLLLDPIEELLLKTKNYSASENETSGETTVGPAVEEVEEPKTVIEGLENFVKKLLECKMKVIFCRRRDIVYCFIHCLLSTHRIGEAVKGSVVSMIKSLCDPLGTSFDTGIKLFAKHAKNIKTIGHYLTALNILPETFKRFTRLAANAIPSMILKYSNFNESNIFKAALSDLEYDAKLTSSVEDLGSELINPGCSTLNIFKPVQKIVTIIYEHPKVADIFLTGLWTLSKLFHLITSHPSIIRAPIRAIMGSLQIILGVNCNLIHYTQTGSNATCELNAAVNWEATANELTLPEIGTPIVCGAVPYIPPLEMDDMFPPVFIPETTITTPTPVTEGVHVDGETTEANWVDEIIKNMDLEDN